MSVRRFGSFDLILDWGEKCLDFRVRGGGIPRDWYPEPKPSLPPYARTNVFFRAQRLRTGLGYVVV